MSKKKEKPSKFSIWFESVTHKRIRTLRLISQIAFFFILNGVIIGLSKISLPVPVSMPAGSPFGIAFGGIDAIQWVLASGSFPFLAFGVFFITGATVGKLFCGWACPVGFWQDILSWFPTNKIKVSGPVNNDARGFGNFILYLVLILTAVVGTREARGTNLETEIFTRIPYGVVDPAGTMFITWFYAFFWGYLPGTNGIFVTLDVLQPLFFIKTVILFIIAGISLKIPRAYCRWICPTGALLAPIAKHSILTIKRNPLKCEDGCSKCEDICPTQVPILDEASSGIANELCIMCGNCVDTCPDALSFGFRF